MRFFTVFVEQAFGVGGESAYNTKQLEKTKKIEDMKKVEDRLIKVVFLADVAATMKWDFRPQQNQVQVSFNPLHTGVTLHDLLPSADFIKNPLFKNKIIRNTIRVSTSYIRQAHSDDMSCTRTRTLLWMFLKLFPFDHLRCFFMSAL